MGLSSEKWDDNNNRKPTKLPQRRGRLPVKEPKRQLRVETSSPNIYRICVMKGTPEDPYTQGRDAITRPWGNRYHYAFPSFLMISKVLNKITQDQVEKSFFLTPSW